MIQRIQSLWLLLASVSGLLTLQFPFFTGMKLNAKQLNEFSSLTASSHFLLLILSVATAVAAVITIFLYRDRKTQFRLCLATLLISLINIVIFYLLTKRYSQGNFALSALLSLAVPVFLFLAARGIRKDEKLVKEADRFR